MARALATDVHQHLWPEGFVSELSRRSCSPMIRGTADRLTLLLDGEPDHRIAVTAHDPVVRRRRLSAAGIDRALVAMSSPLGIESLPGEESRPLLDAWHGGVFELDDHFRAWGAIALDGGDTADVDLLLDRGAVGISLPAYAIASEDGLRRLGPILRRLEVRDAPLFIHPGPTAPGKDVPDWWPALTSYVSEMQHAWMAFAQWGRVEHPSLRVCFAMLAGGAPFQVERLAARGGPARACADSRIFYDTASYGPKAITLAASIVGVDQLVHGSDQPVVDGRQCTALGRSAAAAIARENVARLLGETR